MTKEEFAKLLNGREYGKEITKEETSIAIQSDLIILFAYSDDNVEIRGAIHEEIGAWEGTVIYFYRGCLLGECECNCEYYKDARNKSKKVEALWFFDTSNKDFLWEFKTDIPHATFDIFEDGRGFCRGIVFDLKEIE